MRTGAWVATSAAVGFLLYSCGGQNAQGRSPFLFGFEFLVVFGIALGIAAALAGLWYLWRPRNHAV
jgi:hypothetical protein